MGLLDTLNSMASSVNDSLFNFDAPTSPQDAAERARRNALLAASAPTTDFNRANLGATLLAGDNAYADAYNNQMQQDIATNTYNQQMQLQNNLPQILNGMNLDANTKLLLQSMPADQVSQALSSMALTPKTYKYHFSDQYGVYVTDNKGGMQKIAEPGAEWATITPEMVANDPQFANLDPSKTYQINRNGQIKEVGGGGVNIMNQTGVKFLDKAIESYFTNQDNLGGAQVTLDSVNRMIELLDSGLKTGFGQQTINTFKKGLMTLGLDFSEEEVQNIANAEEFIALTNNMILPLVKMLGFNPTDADLKFVIESTAGMPKTREGNMVILKYLQRRKQAEIELGNWEADYFANNPMFDSTENYKIFVGEKIKFKNELTQRNLQLFQQEQELLSQDTYVEPIDLKNMSDDDLRAITNDNK